MAMPEKLFTTPMADGFSGVEHEIIDEDRAEGRFEGVYRALCGTEVRPGAKDETGRCVGCDAILRGEPLPIPTQRRRPRRRGRHHQQKSRGSWIRVVRL